LKIGILALQGDYNKHARAVEKLGHTSVCLKDAKTLHTCDKLIIPGGESTAIIRLIEKLKLRQDLMEFAGEHAIMGTCAGLILLSKVPGKLPFPSLGLINIEVERNAYGRQIDSFIDTVQIELNGMNKDFEGVFIRAPKIKKFGVKVKALGHHGNDVVMAQENKVLVCSFHPELTDDLRIHEYFISSVS